MTGRHKENLALFSAAAYPTFYEDADAGDRACLGTDIDLFFPEHGNARGQVAQARRLCSRCPMKDRCRAWALSRPWNELHGVWGGMTQMDRKAEQMKGQAVCPRCDRVFRLLADGSMPRHMENRYGRWCE